MTALEYLAAHPEIRVTPYQAECCHYLEQQGKRFMVDFGHDNAVALVEEQLTVKLQQIVEEDN